MEFFFSSVYYDFIAIIVMNKKRWWAHVYIHFWFICGVIGFKYHQ